MHQLRGLHLVLQALLYSESAFCHPICKQLLTICLSIFLLMSNATDPRAGELIAGDLAPRGNPDGQLNAGDLVVLQRIVMGDIDPTPTERLVADVGPLTGPDGVLNVVDNLILMRAVLGEITLPPVVDRGIPVAADISRITVEDGGSGTVTVTGESGAVEGYATITLVNYETGARVTTQADADGGFSTSLGAVTGEVIAVAVADAAGNESRPAGVAVGDLLSLDITAPATGSVIDDNAVLVTGNYIGPPDTAITANGVTACTRDGRFYANNVPLDEGTNELRATARIMDNVEAMQSVYVSSSGPAPVRVDARRPCGIAPHEVGFSITNNAAAQIVSAELDADADGTTDQTLSGGAMEIRYTYANPGVYRAVVTIHDENDDSYTVEQMIVVRSASDFDAELRAVYTGMLGRLRVGAIDGALTHLTSTMQNKYSAMFHSSQAELPNIIDQLGTLYGGAIGEDIAQYTVVRDEDGVSKGFPVFVIRCADGVWRIGEM